MHYLDFIDQHGEYAPLRLQYDGMRITIISAPRNLKANLEAILRDGFDGFLGDSGEAPRVKAKPDTPKLFGILACFYGALMKVNPVLSVDKPRRKAV